MSEAARIKTFSAVSSGVIDAEKGIVFGCSVITEGVVAKGWDLSIDITTIAQIKSCADKFPNGVKVKADHGGGVLDIIGSLRNFRVEGSKLVGDLHLLKESENYKSVLELCQNMPEEIGLSVSFSGVDDRGVNGKMLARCTELYSIDLVDQPAANPTGLFSEKIPSEDKGKNMSDANTANIEALQATIKELQAKVKDLTPSDKKEFSELTAPEREKYIGDIVAKSVATEVAKQFSALGVKPGSAPNAAPSTEPTPPAAPTKKDFNALVAEQVTAGKTKAQAIQFCVKNHEKEYAEAREKGIPTL